MQLKKSAGFTLIELLVVVAIIGLLASIILVSLNSARSKAKDSVRVQAARQFATAIALYLSTNNNSYPPFLDTSGGYAESYYPTLDMNAWQNAFASAMQPYITPENDPDRADGIHFYYVAYPNSSWITTNGAWSGLTASCVDHHLFVVRLLDNGGRYRQDCPGLWPDMIIMYVD